MNDSRVIQLEEQNSRLQQAVVRLGRQLEDLQRASALLASARDTWSATFDALTDLVAIIDKDHQIVRINRAMAERLGIRPEEAVGRHCYELMHRTDAPPAFCPHSVLMTDGTAHSVEFYEPALRRFLLVRVAPFTDDAGKTLGSIHVARDTVNGGYS